ncbi:TlpA family protein disulfide reductase [Donghicola sp. C2-DW-16]|uniref:TlpA family protein disulfide reductase n=1 Tax=Donghicola mangrovi TaxID=2729614 RepID=A0ABX2PB11_9RHOB|nr:TlpA disulfide reductase family protein [Donghicola mangrovi]NVO26568.1 TlpA family protein disulfide reductase [Donghicola mangrovi]
MRLVKSLLLYTAMCLVANGPAFAADTAALGALRDGDMKKLSFHADPQPVSALEFSGPDGAGKLSDFKGQIVLVNFWATWCAPCRKEMPMLSALQTELAGDDFRVVTLATGRNAPEGIAKFFDEIGVENLPHYMDHRQAIAREMGVLGLPVTVILNREGQEIGRLMGDADWSSDSAKAILTALINDPA